MKLNLWVVVKGFGQRLMIRLSDVGGVEGTKTKDV